MSIIKDNRGHPAKPGDTVVYRVPVAWRSTKQGEVEVGRVHSLTPKGVRVEGRGRLIPRQSGQFIVCVLPEEHGLTVAWFQNRLSC